MQLLRYSRHILLPEIGIAGQERLLNAKVLIVGLGGLGSPVAMYLAAAGVGHLLLCDFDNVDLSNLQRQLLHNTQTIGQRKVDSARTTLLALNPTIKLTLLPQHGEKTDSVATADVVVDCSDNLNTRLAINQACVKAAKPLVSGAAIRFEGQLAVFRNDLPDNPCYNCLYSQQQAQTETCTQTGVFAPLVGVIGSLQAVETIKLLTGAGQTLTNQLLLFDALNMEWCTLKLTKNPACPTCQSAALSA